MLSRKYIHFFDTFLTIINNFKQTGPADIHSTL